jgi:hypothetical protein
MNSFKFHLKGQTNKQSHPHMFWIAVDPRAALLAQAVVDMLRERVKKIRYCIDSVTCLREDGSGEFLSRQHKDVNLHRVLCPRAGCI